MSILARQAMGQLRTELTDLKGLMFTERNQLELQYESLNSSWENLAADTDQKARAEEALRSEVLGLEELLRESKEFAEALRREVEALRESNREMLVEKDKCVREAIEKMARERKAEIESMRSRFKLMAVTTMERSPSDTNLEMERGDIKELSTHEAIISQVGCSAISCRCLA